MIQLKKATTFLPLALIMLFMSCAENETTIDTPNTPNVTEDNFIIQFKDNNLKKSIKEALTITKEDISYSDIKAIDSLDLVVCNDFNNDGDVTTLSGIENFTNLTYLKITNPCDIKLSVTDLTPLATLSKLESLELNYSSIDDLTPLVGLTNLKTLKIQRSQITDLSIIKGLKQLIDLDLEESLIEDFSDIKDLTNLTSLSLTSNDLKNNFDFLNTLTNLKKLNLINCDLTTVNTFSNLNSIEEVNLSLNNLNDIKSLCDIDSSFSGSINLTGNRTLNEAAVNDVKSCLPKANILF
ncbi:hypothetical protein MPF19_15410 [Polaribacter sp. Z014]|uniref:leucine-rich repeat domain-containing protein n=1 Tax=Polaribacter sp. Z014 TaxID=2927126 RepID=UPI00202051FD|nr:hypothetical protein [Polaribacter sp. Z014]MCL7764811.1 hypothetical protein [Polaribacter sp. Z014]